MVQVAANAFLASADRKKKKGDGKDGKAATAKPKGGEASIWPMFEHLSGLMDSVVISCLTNRSSSDSK